MTGYGTKVLCGVTPGRGGQEVSGIPVVDTVAEAKERFPEINTSVIFVPNRVARDAAFEAIDAGIKFVILIPERVPQRDMIDVVAYSREKGARVIGPNTIGMLSPGRGFWG